VARCTSATVLEEPSRLPALRGVGGEVGGVPEGSFAQARARITGGASLEKGTAVNKTFVLWREVALPLNQIGRRHRDEHRIRTEVHRS
jgi:hypothetical protein